MNEKQEIERSHKSLSENVSLKEEAGSPIISALENIHSASYYCDLHTDTYQVIKQPAEMEAYIPHTGQCSRIITDYAGQFVR